MSQIRLLDWTSDLSKPYLSQPRYSQNAKLKTPQTSKLKVQAEIQKDQLRVKAKKIDDLQSAIGMLKEKDFDIHLEFVNYR